MRSHWSLVAFTLLIQSAAGSVRCMQAAAIWHAGSGHGRSLHFHIFATLMAALAGLAAAAGHLGHPRAGFNAIRNLKGSWLSRESATVSIFIGVLVIMAAISLIRPGSLIEYVLPAGSLAAGAVLWAMIHVYRIRTVPSWNHGAYKKNISHIYERFITMKITSIDVLELKPRNDKHWRPIVCRINTDEGLYGYGEAAMAYGVGASAAFGMIKDLAGNIIGMDPLENEVIWEKLHKATFWGQNGGPVVFGGISAIDIALWDIKGKYFNVPVYKLLGGKRREKLRSYASQLQFRWDDGINPVFAAEDYATAAKKAVSEGYDAIKIDFFTYDRDGRQFSSKDTTTLLKPYYLDLVEERIAAVREAVGPAVDIIIECHSFSDVQSAIQVGKRAEKYDIFCYEEPTSPSPKMTKLVAANVNIPIASGERIYTRWGYAPYFENGSLALIQPDLGTSGGITEGKKICDMAYTYDVSVQVHVCASPLSVAAALQLEAVIPNFCIHEHHVINKASYNRELCVHDYQPVDGYMTVPELPGLGNDLSEYALKTADKITVSTAKAFKMEKSG